MPARTTCADRFYVRTAILVLIRERVRWSNVRWPTTEAVALSPDTYYVDRRWIGRRLRFVLKKKINIPPLDGPEENVLKTPTRGNDVRTRFGDSPMWFVDEPHIAMDIAIATIAIIPFSRPVGTRFEEPSVKARWSNFTPIPFHIPKWTYKSDTETVFIA
jgi:hypothetical protein